jgi:hypothetical protein
MLHNEQSGAQLARQQRQRRRQDIREEAGSLASAEYQERERTRADRSMIALCRPVDHHVGHGIAGEARTGQRRTLQEFGVLEGGGDGRDALCQHAIGPSEHGVLLV